MNKYEKSPTALKDLAIKITIFLKIALHVNSPPFLLLSKSKSLTAILFIDLFNFSGFLLMLQRSTMLFRLELIEEVETNF